MFLCFTYDKSLLDNVKILTNDKVWQLLPLYPQGLLQKKAKLVWHDLFLTDLCWFLIISFIWLFPLFFFFLGMKLNWEVCNFLSSPHSFLSFWHLIQPLWVFKAFKAHGSETASISCVNKLEWLETIILYQYILTFSALFLDPDLPPSWLLLIILAINLQVTMLLETRKSGIKCFGLIDNVWGKALTKVHHCHPRVSWTLRERVGMISFHSLTLAQFIFYLSVQNRSASSGNTGPSIFCSLTALGDGVQMYSDRDHIFTRSLGKNFNQSVSG